jgi:hypothetical protein
MLASLTADERKTTNETERKSIETLRPLVESWADDGEIHKTNNIYEDYYILRGGKEVHIEFKSEEYKSKTGSLFIELFHDLKEGKLGWFYRCRADYMLYHFINPGMAYLFKIDELREYLSKGENIKLSTGVPQSKHKQRNLTYGLLVNIERLKYALSSFKTYDVGAQGGLY